MLGESEGRFHVVPYETGKYKFCLRLNQDKTGSRYVLSREAVWDLHFGHAETAAGADSLKEQDTQGLWQNVNKVRLGGRGGEGTVGRRGGEVARVVTHRSSCTCTCMHVPHALQRLYAGRWRRCRCIALDT